MHDHQPLPPPVRARALTVQEKAARKAGADLCLKHPATWSAMVRYQDQLIRDGHDEVEADRIAWEHFVPGVPWTSPV